MTSSDLPLHFKLAFVALLSCFEKNEKSICTTRLRARRYTSHALLDRQLIKRLEQLGVIKTKRLTSSKFSTYDVEVFIQGKGKARANPSAEALVLLGEILNEIKNNGELLWKFEDLLLCLLAGECIEYARFYAERNGVQIEVDPPSFQQTKNLLTYCSVGQVNMLFWRAAHNLPKDSAETDFKLEDLLELAKAYYVKYVQQGIEVRNYERLRSAKLSKLSYLLLYDILKTPEKDHHLIGPASYIEHGIQSIVL